MQEGFKEVIDALCGALVQPASDVVIISGCEVSASGTLSSQVTGGWVYSRTKKELIRVVGGIGLATPATVRLEVFDDPAPFGQVRFADNINRQAHIDRVYKPSSNQNANTTDTIQSLPRLTNELAEVVESKEIWHYVGTPGEPSFQNGWGSTLSPLGFKKDPLTKRLYLRGYMSGGSMGGATVFTLPVGYRPLYTQEFAAWVRYSNNASEMARILIRMDPGSQGAVGIYLANTSNVSFVSLDGLSFPLD